jgi:hypothetical protein
MTTSAGSPLIKRALRVACGLAILYLALMHLHYLWHLLTAHGHSLAHLQLLLNLLLDLVVEALCMVGGALLLLGE